MDAAVKAEMQAQHMPGLTIAIARNGAILYSQAYGYADLPTCRRMQIADPMQIGSVTKQFTASAVMQLREAGLVDLDHTVASYLPNHAFDSRLTVRMLLNMTSGLPDYLEFPSLQQYAFTGGSQSLVLDAIAQATLKFTPGTAHEYSNSNYFLLGSIIEAVSGKTYADYLTTEVFPLAGLSHTTYLQPSDSASPYGNVQVTGPNSGKIVQPSAYFAAGQLWSNVEDLALWDDAWFGGEVVSQESMDLMLAPAAVNYFQPSNLPSDYGMGWVTHPAIAGHPLIWHNGGTTSYTSFNGVLMDTGFSVTVLTNYTLNEPVAFLAFAEQLIDKVCMTAAAGGC